MSPRRRVADTALPSSVRWPGPKLGQRSGEVLAEIGITDAELTILREKGLA
ncbi:hypothetical protein [Arthrobacter sp. CG_A4]|uniref:hypothetical protein n=1 Tax=Arthrobacter sp. CG_A4 TaxID=3071706 RepID=UPI002DF9637F|nr:crotonobetainyl-CoA:carnitine CoA-transferase CaiB-like acyl-CoA transferase [Arthrobacter sp. CG_A4]